MQLKFMGLLVKLIWAFLWQEEFMTPAWIIKYIPLHIGAAITPMVMHLGTTIDGFT